MNAPDPIARFRTHDAGMNAALEIDRHAKAEQIATFAVLMNRGLISGEELRALLMRSKAAT